MEFGKVGKDYKIIVRHVKNVVFQQNHFSFCSMIQHFFWFIQIKCIIITHDLRGESVDRSTSSVRTAQEAQKLCTNKRSIGAT